MNERLGDSAVSQAADGGSNARVASRWRIKLLLIAVLLASSTWFIVPLFQSHKHKLERAVCRADCIVVGPMEPEPGIPTATIQGREAVTDLLRRIEFEPSFRDGRCGCEGNPVIRFCQGETTLLKMTIHHGMALRVNDLTWRSTDLPLTSSSRALIVEWLRAHGYLELALTSPAPQ